MGPSTPVRPALTHAIIQVFGIKPAARAMLDTGRANANGGPTLLPPHIIRDILERERARKEAPQPQLEISLPLPSRAPERPAPATDEERGVVEIELF